MEHKCLELDEIAAAAKLLLTDPRRRQLEECPRCSSQLLLYQQFMSAEAPEEADLAGADAHLADFMSEAIDRRAASPDTSSGDAPAWAGLKAWFGRLLAPSPALAGAAALLVVVMALAVWRPWTADQPVFRKDVSTPPGSRLLITESPEEQPDGSVRLAWQPVPGADSYQLLFRTPELAELAVFGPMTEISFILNRSQFPPDSPDLVLWQVSALRGGDEIARSRPASLKLP